MSTDGDAMSRSRVDETVTRGDSLRGRSVLVAFDRTNGSRAAAVVGAALATAHRMQPQVVHAFNIEVAARSKAVASMIAAADELLGPAVHEPLRLEIIGELEAITHGPVGWPVHIHPGSPAAAIVMEAGKQGAALVVMGLRHHGAMDRVLRDETTLNVVRGVSCPVLAVAPTLTRGPRSALVAMDFSDGAIAAARFACSVVGPAGSLLLAHVVDTRPAPVATGYPPLPPAEIDARFDEVLAGLGLSAGMKVERIVLDSAEGTSPAITLLEAAVGYGADIVAAGSRGQGFIDRFFLGSVSTELIRDGRQSVLIVPPARRDA
jgi:nucleotide-binding universal stress UspA family protein